MQRPNYYDPSDVEKLYMARKDIVHKEAIESGLTPSKTDKKKIGLFMIDNQLDFIFNANGVTGSLAVPGAMDDTVRIIEFIYKNMEVLTNIYASMDTHRAWQIFHPTWWLDENGKNPDPFTPVTSADISSGKFRPVSHPLESIEYVKKLETSNKYVLTIWPYHTMLGDVGFAMPPALFEAILFHDIARVSQSHFETKGTHSLTEHYSVLGPEVMELRGKAIGHFNTSFFNMLGVNDILLIGGQAKSHCLMSTLDHLIEQIMATNPDLLKKIRLLEDATSPVAPPPLDPLPDFLNFPVIADKRFDEYESKYGIPRVKTTDPII